MEAGEPNFYKNKIQKEQEEEIGDLDLSLYLYISEMIFFIYSRRDK